MREISPAAAVAVVSLGKVVESLFDELDVLEVGHIAPPLLPTLGLVIAPQVEPLFDPPSISMSWCDTFAARASG